MPVSMPVYLLLSYYFNSNEEIILKIAFCFFLTYNGFLIRPANFRKEDFVVFIVLFLSLNLNREKDIVPNCSLLKINEKYYFIRVYEKSNIYDWYGINLSYRRGGTSKPPLI